MVAGGAAGLDCDGDGVGEVPGGGGATTPDEVSGGGGGGWEAVEGSTVSVSVSITDEPGGGGWTALPVSEAVPVVSPPSPSDEVGVGAGGVGFEMMTVVVSQSSSSDEVGAPVDVSQPLAVTMVHDVSQPMPRQPFAHGKDMYEVAGTLGQPQFWVWVLRTRHSGRGQV